MAKKIEKKSATEKKSAAGAKRMPRGTKKHNMHFLLAEDKFMAVTKIAAKTGVTITSAMDVATDLYIKKNAKVLEAA